MVGTGGAGVPVRWFKSESFHERRSSASLRAGAGPASSGLRPWRRRRRSTKVSFEISLKVSVMPRPALATASTKGYEERPSASWSASTERTSVRSRLLYWMTIGIPSKETPFAFRFSLRFCQLEILRQHRPLGVGDEDDPVGALQDDAAGLVEGRLARNGGELEPDLVALDVAELDRKQVEVDGAIRLGCEIQELPNGGRLQPLVEQLQVGGLSPEAGTVVDDLGGQLARGGVVDDHDDFCAIVNPLDGLAPGFSPFSAPGSP